MTVAAARCAYRFTPHHERRTTTRTSTARTLAADRLVAGCSAASYRQGAAPGARRRLAGPGRPARAPRDPAAAADASTGGGRSHDRVKRRLLPEGEPVPFLVELGVMTAGRQGALAALRQVPAGQPVPRARRGRRSAASRRDRCASSTSARASRTSRSRSTTCSTVVHGREVEIVGLDLKPDVVGRLRGARTHARRRRACRFEVGDIAGCRRSTASISSSASTPATPRPTTRSTAPCAAGAPRDPRRAVLPARAARRSSSNDGARSAAPARHAARAVRRRGHRRRSRPACSELAGYDVQVVEFVELEHTPKNVLLRAVRTVRPERDRARLAREYRTFADSLGIRPALERLLGDLVPL